MNGEAERALETGIVVSYARPFTRQGTGQLDEKAFAPDDPRDAKLHRSMIWLRNKLFAHTDVTGLRDTIDVFDTGRFSESRVSFADDEWPQIVRLAEAQGSRPSRWCTTLSASSSLDAHAAMAITSSGSSTGSASAFVIESALM